MDRRRFNLGLIQTSAALLTGCTTVAIDLQPTDPLATSLADETPLSAHQPFGLTHVMVTGQSLATGYAGTPALSTTQPYGNLMFDAGARLVPDGTSGDLVAPSGLTLFVPLIETNYQNQSGETICSGFANRTFARLASPTGQDILLMDVNGEGGTLYAGLKRGTNPYANGIAAVTAAKSIYKSTGKPYGVAAVIAIHGEADEAFDNTAYTANLVEWQANYNQDIQAITGQTATIPLQICQMASGWEDSNGAHNIIPQQQVDAAMQNPGRIILACPKYMLPYHPGDVHLTSDGYRWLGEYHSRAYEYLLQGKQWQPLWPIAIAHTSSTQVLVTFNVPAGPLVFDTNSVTEPTSIPGQKYGFEVFNPTGRTPSITTVTLIGSNQVLIQFDTPLVTGARLRYAYSRPTQNGVAGIAGPSGDTAGNRGNLRDSDHSASLYGRALFNWCVTFDMPIN
jgi:hypothetical protein